VPSLVSAIYSSRKYLYFESTELIQIDNYYDVHLAGQLDYYNSTQDTTGQTLRKTAFLDPFKIVIGGPYNLLFNTAPKIIVFPLELFIEAGSSG